MPTQSITLELPTAVLERFAKIAAATQRPIADLIAQSIATHLPPLPENAPPELMQGLLQMQNLDQEKLAKLAQARISNAHYQRFGDLLELSQGGQITVQEQQELEQLRLKADVLMQQKAYAQAILQWRGQGVPGSEALAV